MYIPPFCHLKNRQSTPKGAEHISDADTAWSWTLTSLGMQPHCCHLASTVCKEFLAGVGDTSVATLDLWRPLWWCGFLLLSHWTKQLHVSFWRKCEVCPSHPQLCQSTLKILIEIKRSVLGGTLTCSSKCLDSCAESQMRSIPHTPALLMLFPRIWHRNNQLGFSKPFHCDYTKNGL